MGGRVRTNLRIRASIVSIRRTGGSKTVTLFKRGCSRGMHIMSVNSFSGRLYNNARITGANGVVLFGVISRSNVTTNIHHVRTLAKGNILRCCGGRRRLLRRTTGTLGTGPTRVMRGVKRLRKRMGTLSDRGRSLGDGLTRKTLKSIVSGMMRIGNIGLLTTGMSKISVGKLHSLNSRLGNGLNRNIILLTTMGNRGMGLLTVTASTTRGTNTRTNGLVGTITTVMNNNNNKHPGVTRTNKGGPSGTRRTMSTTTKVLRNRVGWGLLLLAL